MSRYLVTIGAGTGAGKVIQSCATTVTINKKPVATVGSIATHPQAPDVVIEGAPGILLNGIPVAFSTGKTAMGGSLVANTSVKISAPSAEAPFSYTGFAAAPRVENEEEKQREPEKSKEVKLTSDYARQQLISIAKTDGRSLFIARMIQIFGKDVTPKALEKLYDECRAGSIENPPVAVCKNCIYGLQAAYNSDTREIMVSEDMVYRAVEDNRSRNILMAALVEEYGHHIDYLLRYKFDKNKNKDAKGDEGARFAYHGLYNIAWVDFFNTASVSFASAETPDGRFELTWDFSVLQDVLREYTAPRQSEDFDDHAADHIEGFKVEDLSYGGTKQNAFGHENIQRVAIRRANPDIPPPTVNYLYRGNWMRDFSQLLAPFLISTLGKLDTNVKNMDDLFGKIKNNELTYQEKDTFNNIFHPKDTIPFFQDIVRLLALKQFHDNSRPLIYQSQMDDDFDWRVLVDGPVNIRGYRANRNGLIPGFGQLLGVSVPHDHFDNPYGLKDSSALNKFLDTKSVSEFNREITGEECTVDKRYGVKKYIRTDGDTSGYGSRMVYGHLTDTLTESIKKIRDNDPHIQAMGYVQLGGVLHTVQDFFAHSNYSETYLASIWFDRVRTWTQSDRNLNWSGLTVHGSVHGDIILDADSKEAVLRGYGDTVTIAQRGKFVHLKRKIEPPATFKIADDPVNAVHKKAFYTPITTGTYDPEDLIATAMVMLSSHFELKPEPAKNARGIEVGERTPIDFMLLRFARFYDTRSKETGGEAIWEQRINDYLEGRDRAIVEYAKERKFLWVEFSLKGMVDSSRKISEAVANMQPFKWINDIIDQVRRSVMYFIVHNVTQVLLSFIRNYQEVLKPNLEGTIAVFKKSIEEWQKKGNKPDLATVESAIRSSLSASTKDMLWGNYPKNNNPSHTMLAKDEATHPIHGLAGDMAVTSTELLFKQVAADMRNRTDGNAAKRMLDEIIRHPLFDTVPDADSHFRDMTEIWAKENPVKVLKLCVTSYLFESIRASVAMMGKAIKMINEYKQNDLFNRFEKNRLFNESGMTQTAINEVNGNMKTINKQLNELINLYNKSPYRELDWEICKEWYTLYAGIGVFPRGKDIDELKQKWSELVDKMSDTAKQYRERFEEWITNAVS